MNEWKQKLKMRLPAIALLAATLLFWGYYDRYEPAAPSLLQSPSLTDAGRLQGDCTESNGWFRLVVLSGGKTASINFPITDGTAYDLIRVRGAVKVDGVISGRHAWSCARLLLTQYDGNNKWIPGHHGIVALDGTSDWSAHEDVFEIDPKADHVDLVIQQLGKMGSAEFKNLVAEPVRLRDSFVVFQWLFIILWLVMAVLYFKRCRLLRRKLRLLILLNAAAIIFGVLMPENWIEDTSDYMADEAVKMVVKAKAGSDVKQVDKNVHTPKKSGMEQELNRFNERVGGLHGAGHFTLFATLCFLVYLSAALERQHSSYYFKVAFDVLLFAAITESLQYLTLDRTPGLSDWMVDLYGMLTAVLLFLVVKRIFLRRSLPVQVT